MPHEFFTVRDIYMRKAALFYDYNLQEGEVFGQGRLQRIEALTDLYPTVVNRHNFANHAANLRDVEVIFATWGMVSFSDEQLAQLPELKAVFYAAGNVKAFASPLIGRDILLMSAWAINAIPAAEMVLSQVLLSCRGYFRSVRNYKADPNHADHVAAKAFPHPGVNGETVGVIGLGYIGTALTKHLQHFGFNVLASDPYLTVERAAELGVEKVSLEELFERSYIVSNHIPDLPATKNVLNAPLFEAMRDGATFINTGRGAQVVEADLIRVMSQRPDLTALLDVTYLEPPTPDSALWNLPNVVMSPHVGGTTGDEVVRLSDCAIEEFIAWDAGKPLRYQVTREVLETMG